MGEALALEHHSRGYRVFATSRTLASMESLAAQGIETLALDVTLSESIREVKEEISKRTGGQLHFLVNNAGAAGPIPVTDIDMSSARKMYDVNVFGVIEVTHLHSSPHCCKRRVHRQYRKSCSSGALPLQQCIRFHQGRFDLIW